MIMFLQNKAMEVIYGNHLLFKCRSENTWKFLLRDLAALTNSICCNYQHGALINRFPVIMTLIGWREFPTIF